jgi:hypothetical protein
MPYRNKTYVCFDADNDIHYYRLMLAWKQSDNTNFNFYNAHDLNRLLPTSSEETIKRKLRERLLNTKVLVVLVGAQTRYLYRFVRWEMEQALKIDLPIIAVNLNGRRSMDSERCPPIIRDELAIHVSFNAAIIQYALEHWESRHHELRRANKTGPYYYKAEIYKRLGL